MVKEYCITEFAHNSIYTHNKVKDNYKNRKINIYFSEPDAGINSYTGIIYATPLLLHFFLIIDSSAWIYPEYLKVT